MDVEARAAPLHLEPLQPPRVTRRGPRERRGQRQVEPRHRAWRSPRAAGRAGAGAGRAGARHRREALGLIDPKEPQSSRDALHALLDSVLVVFTARAQPVDFQDKQFVDEAGARLKAYYRALTCSPPPAQLLFLHRKLGGVYSMGRALKARLDLLPYAARLQRS